MVQTQLLMASVLSYEENSSLQQVVMIVGPKKVLMWPNRWCLIGFVGFSSVRKSILLNNLAGVCSEVSLWIHHSDHNPWYHWILKMPRYHWRCHGPAHGSPGCHWRCQGPVHGSPGCHWRWQWWKRQMSSCLCRVQTCHLIWIVLDVLKHLGHKKITENKLEGFGIHSTSKYPKVDLKKKDKGGITLSAPVSGKAIWSSLLMKGTGGKSGFKCVETGRLRSFWLFYLDWDHLVALQWLLYKIRLGQDSLSEWPIQFDFFFLVLCLGWCGNLGKYCHEVAANILCL